MQSEMQTLCGLQMIPDPNFRVLRVMHQTERITLFLEWQCFWNPWNPDANSFQWWICSVSLSALQCIRCLRMWRRSTTLWTTPWVWGSIDCGRTRCCTSCTHSPGRSFWMWLAEQVKHCVCNSAEHQSSTPDWRHTSVFFCLSGDIAFRFLEYVRSQQERQKRRATRSMQTPSWQDISNNYSTEDEEGPQESRAVVCDINKEMLKVGKEKAESMGVSAGKETSDQLWDCEVFVSMLTCAQIRLFGYLCHVTVHLNIPQLQEPGLNLILALRELDIEYWLSCSM